MRFLTPVERLLYLHTAPLFGDLPPERLALFAEQAEVYVASPGEELFNEGVGIDAVYILVEGELALEREGREAWHVRPGQTVGVLEHFAGFSVLSLVARGSALTLRIGAEALRGILEDYFDVVLHVFRALAGALIERRKQLTEGAGFSAERRAALPAFPRPFDLVHSLFILRKALPLGGSSIDALAALARFSREEEHAAGKVLWQQGDEAKFFYVVFRGEIACTASDPAQSFGFGAGDGVGILDAIACAPRWYEARVVSDVVLLRIEVEDFNDVLEDHFEMSLECLGSFATQGLVLFEALEKARDDAAVPGEPSAPTSVRFFPDTELEPPS